MSYQVESFKYLGIVIVGLFAAVTITAAIIPLNDSSNQYPPEIQDVDVRNPTIPNPKGI